MKLPTPASRTTHLDREGGPKRLNTLTALRALAAFAVFAHHVNAYLLGNHSLDRFVNQGVDGVSFFFILSGFVLAWSSRPDATRAFYRRRAARILPLYYIAWLMAFVITPHGLTSQVLSLPLIQAWFPSSTIHFAGNSVAWSLSCEGFFYALFPWLIARIGGSSDLAVKLMVLGASAFALMWPLVLHPAAVESPSYWLIYVLPLTRFAEFAVGVGLAVLLRRGIRMPISVTVASLLSLAAYLGSGWLPLYAQPVAATLIPFGLLIVAAAQHDRSTSHRGGHNPLFRIGVRLGEWSYAFYLVHVTVIRVLAHEASFLRLPLNALAVVSLLGSVAVAGALCEWVEKPLERRLRGDRALPVSLDHENLSK